MHSNLDTTTTTTTANGNHAFWPSSTAPEFTSISSWDTPDSPTPFIPFPDSHRPFSASLQQPFFTLVIDTIPREIYLTFLLRLPSFYSPRLSDVFLEYEMSKIEIQKMAVQRNVHLGLPADPIRSVPGLSASSGPYGEFSDKLGRFKKAWTDLIDALLRDWKILNIVSALVLPAILTILQIDAANTDPVARTVAVMSLLCALMSLLYGCLYTIRFATMRQLHKAAMWASGAEKQKTAIFWSPAVMIAMPVVWISWSLILFLVCIMTYVWRSQSIDDPLIRTTTAGVALGTRIAISSILLLGIIYLCAMIHTFSHYSLNATWRERVKAWIKEASQRNPTVPIPIPGDLTEWTPNGQPPPVARPYLAFPGVGELDSVPNVHTSVIPPAQNQSETSAFPAQNHWIINNLTPPQWSRIAPSDLTKQFYRPIPQASSFIPPEASEAQFTIQIQPPTQGNSTASIPTSAGPPPSWPVELASMHPGSQAGTPLIPSATGSQSSNQTFQSSTRTSSVTLNPVPPTPGDSSFSPFSRLKVGTIPTHSDQLAVFSDISDLLLHRGLSRENWEQLARDIARATPQDVWDALDWTTYSPHDLVVTQEDLAFHCISTWNRNMFFRCGMQALLCAEFTDPQTPPGYAIYLVDTEPGNQGSSRSQTIAELFGPVPAGLDHIVLIDVEFPSSSRLRKQPLGITIDRPPATSSSTKAWTSFKTFRAFEKGVEAISELSPSLAERGVSKLEWQDFLSELNLLKRRYHNRKWVNFDEEDDIFRYISSINERYFYARGIAAVFCGEWYLTQPGMVHAVYMVDIHNPDVSDDAPFTNLFGPVPPGLHRICLMHSWQPSVVFAHTGHLGTNLYANDFSKPMMARDVRSKSSPSPPATEPTVVENDNQ
ncbi:hypothetical protein C8J56DRAFT_865920 [Mycena floridula]|nr:hypothetical protein C8J56DRAFT_865920 [Mycena floridula]